MGVELRPLGVACNIGCVYCYQDPMRDAGNYRQRYDLAKMKEALLRANEPFTLFGGEPLLVPIADLEELFALGLEKFGRNSIQTNGTLVNDEHLRLFRTYKVGVGISIDGPDELNDLRWHRNLEQTRRSTARIEAVIERLCAAGTPPGLIVTLHRGNATAAHLPKMHAWMRRLDAMGVRSVRLHLLEIENETVRTRHSLSLRENVEALLSFEKLQPELRTIRFDLFQEMETLLLGSESEASCVWRNCDPYRTNAVVGIEGNGQSSNCGRTNKDGVDYTKADTAGYERSITLWQTPQAEGGCQGCRFFLMCRGQCPGTAIGGDWRNRSELCEVWKALFSRLEEKLILEGKSPFSLSPFRRAFERKLVDAWRQGQPIALQALPAGVQPADALAAAPRAPHAFLRIAWVSDPARARWEPPLARVRDALLQIAVAAVADGVVACAVRRVPEALKPNLIRRALAAGVVMRELDPVDPTSSRPGRVLLGSDEYIRAYLALPADDPAAEAGRGELLGYPACCCAAKQPLNAGSDTEDAWLTNVYLRAIGVSLLGHIPCSADCAESRAIARRMFALGEAAGLGEEMRLLREILSWPLHVSVLHGIAEIRTPVFKIACDAAVNAGKIERRHRGRAIAPPEFAARSRLFAMLEGAAPSAPVGAAATELRPPDQPGDQRT